MSERDHVGDVHEWRVTGQPPQGFPFYDFIWRSLNCTDPEGQARTFHAKRVADGDWADLRLRHRVVTYTEWASA